MEYGVTIIGAGVVGLACAAQLSSHGYSVLLIDKHESFGMETSSRNSEVIHSGIYYPIDSLKARLCVAANKKIYKECDKFGVWYNRIGKLIVAVNSEEEILLVDLYNNGLANGVEDMKMLSTGDVKKIEPNINCLSAIYLPSTGIIDSYQLMKAYFNQANSNGVDSVFNVEYIGVDYSSKMYLLKLKDNTGEELIIRSRAIINSAGLFSDKVAKTLGININEAGYRIFPNRGHYFKLSTSKSKLVSHLIYPVPQKQMTHLGIHVTLDRAGMCKLGPDSEYIDKNIPEQDWYKFDESKINKFYTVASSYLPFLELNDLSQDQIGVRPKIQAYGDDVKDFIIADESSRGLNGVISLIGIESPGLTCASEIARMVCNMIVKYK